MIFFLIYEKAIKENFKFLTIFFSSRYAIRIGNCAQGKRKNIVKILKIYSFSRPTFSSDLLLDANMIYDPENSQFSETVEDKRFS
jgi:hypothetical protein